MSPGPAAPGIPSSVGGTKKRPFEEFDPQRAVPRRIRGDFLLLELPGAAPAPTLISPSYEMGTVDTIVS